MGQCCSLKHFFCVLQQKVTGSEQTQRQNSFLLIFLLSLLHSLQSTIVEVEGDHHIHLNKPENVAPVITDFLQTHSPEQQDCQTSKL